jgi:ketosteroid isomerase-like protein
LTAIPPLNMIQRVSDAATEPERVYARLLGAFNTRDWVAVSDCLAEDYESVDHRSLGWEPARGPEAVVGFFRSWVEAAPNIEGRVEWLSGDDEHGVLRLSGFGHAADEMGGGAFEVGVVSLVTIRDGRVARADHYAVGDEALVLAHLAELQPTARRPTS